MGYVQSCRYGSSPHLDQGDSAAVGGDGRHLGADAAEELVREHKDEQRCAIDGARQVRVGHHVIGELDVLRETVAVSQCSAPRAVDVMPTSKLM